MKPAKKVLHLHQPDSTRAIILGLKRRIENLENRNGIEARKAFLIVPSDEGSLFLNQQDIIHCKAASSSCVIQTKDHRYCISRTLKWVAERLPTPHFIRVHSSHLINASSISKYRKRTNTVIELTNGTTVPVSRSHRPKVEQFFNL